MRRKIYLEWGFVVPGEEESTGTKVAPLDPAPHYEKLVTARKGLVTATTNGEDEKKESVRNWLGGAISMYASVFGLVAEEVLAELEQAYPLPKVDNPYATVGDFIDIKSERPKPHPGAPKPVPPEVIAAEQGELPEV